jgi:acetyl esterase/lipase
VVSVTLYFLHGGRVDKELARGLGRALAAQGAVVFIPEYQSYEPPADRITKGPEDAACALRLARAKGVDFGGDPNRVILVGHSAGGAFGALVALAGDEYHGDCLVTGETALPDLFIGLDGAYDILRYTPESRLREAPPEQWLRISPYATIGIAPLRPDLSFHLFVGLEEGLLQDAQAFRDALHGAGYHVSLTQFPGVDPMYMASGNHANMVWAISTLMHQ